MSNIQTLVIYNVYPTYNLFRQSKYHINYLAELTLSLCVWFIFTLITYSLEILSSDNTTAVDLLNLFSICTLLGRNMICLGVTLFYSQRKLPEEEQADWCEIDPECFTMIEKVLDNKWAFIKFVAFLKDTGNIRGEECIDVYAFVSKFEIYAEQGDDAGIKHKAQGTFEQIRNTCIGLRGMREEYLDNVIRKLDIEGESVDKHLFDQLYGVAINGLQAMLPEFRESVHYSELSKEQERRALIAARLKTAKLIDAVNT